TLCEIIGRTLPSKEVIYNFTTMKKSKPLHCLNFKPLIEEAIKKLKNGENRLAVSDYPLKYACLNGFNTPDFSERLSSNYRMPSENKDIEADYFEEITLLEKMMADANIPINFADWQKGTKIESSIQDTVEKMHKGLNRRALAIQLWDWYAIPWRYKNNAIHIIWSPQDVMGTPIIHSYPVDFFLSNFSSILENQAESQLKAMKQLGFWKNFGIVAIIIFAIFLYVKFL
ncbi:MAG TPA: hypothetical protein GX747_01170, partial [Tenericutes bacterium]|nr:hypothetical protein [Mycoplasmatota bacterium]